ncbi:MAG TPA: hypothetical protein GYA10_00340 [Alphaproteobacteria bacterium]|nr:hypothetical protein [Alphaproteobacteria bacterium]
MIVAPAAGTSPATASEAPLVIDEDLVQRRDAAVARVLEEDTDPRPAGRRIIEEDMLEEWDSGSLAEYLERKGLMSGSEQASASDFGDDDLFLDDDRSEVRVVRRLPRRNDFFFF